MAEPASPPRARAKRATALAQPALPPAERDAAGGDAADHRDRWRRRLTSTGDAIIVALLWAGGMLVAFGPTLRSGLRLIQRDWGDTRLNNYILEHGWRWLAGVPGHERLWSPPVFYPAPNTFAYSDVLLSVAPPYWALRAAGVAPDTAFQLWELLMATLNYAVALLFLRRVVRTSVPAAALGAAVFAFAGMRIAQIQHPQLIPQFLVIGAVWGAARLCAADARGSGERGGTHAAWWIALLFGCIVAQLYAAFYYAWFLALSLGIAAAWALASRATRAPLVATLRRHAGALATASALAALAAFPLAEHYLRAARQVGFRDFGTVLPFLPRPASWVYLGVESRMYGWLAPYHPFASIPMGHEQRLGLGLVTSAVVVAGLWRGRARPLARLMALASITIVLVATLWPGEVTAWRIVYAVVPGASALRAISRIALMLLVPAAVGVALFADAIPARRPAGVLVLAATALAIALEQRQALVSYDKYVGRARVHAVAALVRPDCQAFLYAPTGGREDPWWYHVDAMWASMAAGVPTINGYSGNQPPWWSFYHNVAYDAEHARTITHDLDAWARRWRLDRGRLCVVSLTPPD
ncbi:MAG TPA: hypothetical protein VF041_00335 [Gemmatimonadaceae bacterium]